MTPADPAHPAVPGPQRLRAVVAELLEEEPGDLADDTNLFEAGLDSILLMRLVSSWRKAGIRIDFAELAQHPTLAAWTALLTERAPAPADPSGAPAASATGTAAGADPDDPEQDFELGHMQHAYWAGRSDAQRLGAVAAHLYTEFDAAPGGAAGADPGVHPDRLAAAVQRLVARHPTLRSRVTEDGRQQVLAAAPVELVVHDLRTAPAAEVDAHLADVRERLSHQVLDVEHGEVFSVALTRLPGGRSRLHLDVDMIAADAASYRVLLADLAALHDDPDAALPPIGLTYRDYLAGRSTDRADDLARATEHWAQRLPGLPGAPVLAEAVPAPGTPPRVARRHLQLPADAAAALAAAARAHRVTTAMAVAAVFAEVVGAWSAVPRFLLNVPLFDRAPVHPDVDLVAGDFSSSVMLEVDLTEPVPFVERVRRVQQRMHADAAHAAYPGLEVLRGLTHRGGEQVLAPVVFTSALNLGELFAPVVRERFGEPVWIISQGPQVLLDAQLTELSGGLLVNWDSREEAFPPGVLDAMFAAFGALLGRLIDDPAAWSEPVLVGAPVGDRRRAGQPVRVVDEHGRDRPDHVPGRLLAPADGAAEGADGWIRTGEWARAVDGAVRSLGADADQRVVHGVRVGPVEVAEVLRSDPRIREVAVVPLDEGLGAVVAGPSPDAEALRAELRRRVPAHLVPARIAVVGALPADPVAVRGLLDAAPVAGSEQLAPRSDLERVIALVWAEVLDLPRVGVTEEFVALGGDSLLAARIVARLREGLDTDEVSLRTLFRAPTVARLAERMRAEAADPARLDQVAEIYLEIQELSDDEVAAELDASRGRV